MPHQPAVRTAVVLFLLAGAVPAQSPPAELVDSLARRMAAGEADPVEALALVLYVPVDADDARGRLVRACLEGLAGSGHDRFDAFDEVMWGLVLAEGAHALYRIEGDELEPLRERVEERLRALASAWLAERGEDGLWADDTTYCIVRLYCLYAARDAGSRIPATVFAEARRTIEGRFDSVGGGHEAMAYALFAGASKEARARIREAAAGLADAGTLATSLLAGEIGGWPEGLFACLLARDGVERKREEREAWQRDFLALLWSDTRTRVSPAARLLCHLAIAKDPDALCLSSAAPRAPRGDLRALVEDTRFGPVLLDVTAGGAADRAGLQAGELVVSVGGQRVRDSVDLDRAVSRSIETDVVEVVVESRRGKRTLQVELDREPRQRRPSLGQLRSPSDPGEGQRWTQFDKEDFERLPLPADPEKLPRKQLEEIAARARDSLPWQQDLASALTLASERGLPVFWYLPQGWKPRRGGGGDSSPTYAGADYDYYLWSTLFSQPRTRALLESRFVLLEAQPTEEEARRYGVLRFEFYDPGWLALAPDGRKLWQFDGFATYSADLLERALRTFLRLHPELEGHSPGETDPGRALEHARELFARGAGDEVSREQRFEIASLQIEQLMAAGRLADAERWAVALSRGDAPEPLRLQAAAARAECAWRLGRQRDAVAMWRELALEHGDSVQGAWAAICLLGKAAFQHGMAPLGAATPQFELTLPTTTLCPRPAGDARELAGQGVLTLLDMQDPGGSWRDTPYAWISSEHRPNTIMAITGIAARALLTWRDVAPERVDEALARAEAYMTDHGNLGVTAIEKCYAYAYCLRYWVDCAASREGEPRQAALDEAARLATKLRAIQHDEAGWGHEYYNPFATAVGLESMALAARAGVVVPPGSIELARSALEAVRHPAGGFPYGMRGSPTTLLASTGRSPVCERALSLAGAPGEDRILAALENFFENFGQLERSRAYDFHSDKFANGGFFYWHDLLPVAEAIAGLESSAAWTTYRERMLPLITATAEADGAWVDSQNIGRSYGTAMAMLAIASLLAGG